MVDTLTLVAVVLGVMSFILITIFIGIWFSLRRIASAIEDGIFTFKNEMRRLEVLRRRG